LHIGGTDEGPSVTDQLVDPCSTVQWSCRERWIRATAVDGLSHDSGFTARRSLTDAVAVGSLRSHRARQATERLAAGAAYEDDDRIFSDELGRTLRPGLVSARFARHVKAAGLPELGIHGLRHTWATSGLEAGVDTPDVSEILGHSFPAITMAVYQHTREERLGNAIAQVGDVIFSRQDGTLAFRAQFGRKCPQPCANKSFGQWIRAAR
jgi:integrase